jgi:hypothetical protein
MKTQGSGLCGGMTFCWEALLCRNLSRANLFECSFATQTPTLTILDRQSLLPCCLTPDLTTLSQSQRELTAEQKDGSEQAMDKTMVLWLPEEPALLSCQPHVHRTQSLQIWK